MAVTKNMTGLGLAPATALAIAGLSATVAGAGTTQANATLLPVVASFLISAGAGNSGVVFAPGVGSLAGYSPGDDGEISNQSGQTIKLYPPTGGKINNGSANASVSLTSNQNAVWWTFDALNFSVLIV